jgi:L-threonylcarbamoyladenylate synthase
MARATAVLVEGSVVAVPTDTVYGLAADAGQPQAVARLFELKERPASVALPVLVAGWAHVEAVVGRLEPAAARLAARHWPGPLTLVVPRRAAFTADLGGPPSARDTVGLRWPDHAVLATLCSALGPLAVTSANRHGAHPARTVAEVEEQFARPRGHGRSPGPVGGGGAELTLALDGGPCAGAPSTVVACAGSSVRCLREGALAFASLAAELSVDQDPAEEDGEVGGGGDRSPGRG